MLLWLHTEECLRLDLVDDRLLRTLRGTTSHSSYAEPYCRSPGAKGQGFEASGLTR